jgi:hypothetical protein
LLLLLAHKVVMVHSSLLPPSLRLALARSTTGDAVEEWFHRSRCLSAATLRSARVSCRASMTTQVWSDRRREMSVGEDYGDEPIPPRIAHWSACERRRDEAVDPDVMCGSVTDGDPPCVRSCERCARCAGTWRRLWAAADRCVCPSAPCVHGAAEQQRRCRAAARRDDRGGVQKRCSVLRRVE